MASAVSPAELQAEASCPVCLDYLRDPVTIECGHNFCRSCLQQRWTGLHVLPCPVCLHHCPDRSCQRNAQLGHLTDVIKQLDSSRRRRRRPRETALCERHREALVLFCEKDLELLCPQCSVSPAHRRHPLTPTARAAARHRRRLRGHAERLREQVEEAEKGLDVQVSQRFELQWKVASQRQKLQSEFEQFNHFFRKELDVVHMRLLTEESAIQEKVIEKKNQMLDHSSTLKVLLNEVLRKCLQTDLDLLTGLGSVYSAYENLEAPAPLSYALKEEVCSLPPQYFGLQNMIDTFQEDLTLDPDTAHHNLFVSQDRKTALFQMTTAHCHPSPQAFTSYPAVLGSERFDAGRHFWQVEVRGVGEWSLGVCRESFPRNAHVSPSPSNGCWQIQLWTSPRDAWHSVHVRRIGVFLDYELGEVSFYNLKNRSHLYTFRERFAEKLLPFFSIGPSSKSLKMSIVKDEHRAAS